MQTFLPYSSYRLTAKCLDRQRLGKQRIETLQILKPLARDILTYNLPPHHAAFLSAAIPVGYSDHPVTRLWAGYEPSLCRYGISMCDEWISRGYNDTTRPKLLAILEALKPFNPNPSCPPWTTDPAVHMQYRRLLLHKDSAHYGKYFPKLTPCESINYAEISSITP